MRRVLSLFSVVGWIGTVNSPAAAQDDAQTCAKASGDDAVFACRRLLETSVTRDCQQIIANRYPFVRGAAADIALSDFTRLFGPGGALDKFFLTYLAAHVDTARQQWTWRRGRPELLAAAALQAFQNAAWIQDAFFQDSRGPTMTLTIAPNAGVKGAFESGGTVIAHGDPPSVFQWPGTSPLTSVLAVGADGRPTTVGRISPWSLFRVLEAGNSRPSERNAFAQYSMTSQLLRYEITVTSGTPGANPLDLASLRRFQCPAAN